MIDYNEFSQAVKIFPSKLQEIILSGHIDKSLFDAKAQEELKKEYPELISEKFEYWGDQAIPLQKSYGLWGETLDKYSVDLGLAAVFIDEDPYPFPRHFMKKKEIYDFILGILERKYPELLV